MNPARPSPLPILPIDSLLPEVVEGLRRHAAVVVRAPPGAGKTTRVPPALLTAGIAGRGQVVMLEPRRIAARAAARWMASELGEPLGETIGYQVRYERCASRRTRILVVTEGILLRRIQADPFLEDVGVVVFDEFHERRLDSDLLLALARRLQSTLRADLKLAVLSATLSTAEAGRIAGFLGDCPILESAGRAYPVEVRHTARLDDRPIAERVAESLPRLLEERPGDALVFLPGVREIEDVRSGLERTLHGPHVLLPLAGEMSTERQDAALRPHALRKIVLATNVAETSVTLPGVTIVVDSGLARVARLDPATGSQRLDLEPISRASATQRAGRAGRTEPGVALRLWTERQHAALAEELEPEVSRLDLSGALLQLLAWGESDLVTFPWLEPPPPAHLEQALRVLELLEAVPRAEQARMGHGGLVRLTPLGRRMAALPVHPRTARFLLEAASCAVLDRGVLLAYLLEERDPWRGRSVHSDPVRPTTSDLLDRLALLERGAAPAGPAGGALPAARRLGKLLRAALREEAEEATGEAAGGTAGDSPPPEPGGESAPELVPTGGAPVRSSHTGTRKHVPRAATVDARLVRCLVTAFPDRVARRREPGSRRGLMVGGRGVLLAPASGVVDGDLFLCHDLHATARSRQGETLVSQASALEAAWLPVTWLDESLVVEFDAVRARVVARRVRRFLDLTLQESDAGAPPVAQAARLLAEAAAPRIAEALPVAEPEFTRWRTRLHWLAHWVPELELPTVDDNTLRAWLEPLCAGKRSFEELRREDLVALGSRCLTSAQRAALEREAPEHLVLPGGRRAALAYDAPERAPVLAARIQDLFGWPDTPRLARGRARVILHLLAPSGRPQQITDDLAGFWRGTYHQVRKDLRARYPKHAWPEDPTSATAPRPRRRPGS